MYEINGSAINAAPINGAATGLFTATGAGALISVEQTVGRIGSGALITVEQTVIQYATGSGALFSIEQSVKALASGALFNIEQRVKDATATSNVDKFGFDALLTIDGVAIPANDIHGQITVTRSENSAALMDVTLINKTGVQDFSLWHGKTITLDIETASGTTRIYTGVVDVPDIDLINKLITLRCSDRRDEQVNEQLANQLPFIGTWSDAIFDTPEDTADELSQRLLTTTKTVDFDAYGNYTISDFLPKPTADFTLADADIYRRKPTLQVASRGRLVNQVNVEFEYRYVRLRHRERNFHLYGATFCDVINTIDLQFLSVEGMRNNLENFAWPVKPNTLDFEYLPGAGWKNCGYGKFLWSPVVYSGTTVNVKDEAGNNVTDSNGNNVTTIANKTVTDYTRAFATEAWWTAAKRFAQNVSEKINIQVNAPQSQNQYGVIARTQRNGYQHEYNPTDFEQLEEYQSPTGFTSSAGDYYLDKTGTPQHYARALRTAVNIAETNIKKSHRDNHVTIETPIWPEIDLKHTVATTAGLIQCKGKVSNIQHTIDITNRFASTTTQLSLSRAQGSQSAGTLSVPILNAPLVGGFGASTIKMYTYLGGELGGVGLGTTGQKTEGIITPAIDDESRDNQTYETNYSFNTNIQNDTLTVTF